jgi:hypothetical protein
MRNLLLPLLFACCAVLSGCYELSEPVLDKGAYAPVAGTFSCNNGMSGASDETFTEQKSGFIFPDYRYTSSDGSEFMFLPLGSNFFAAQMKSKNGRLMIAFVNAADDKELLFLLPDLMSKGPYLETLARKSNVQMAMSQVEPGNVRLVGTKADITAFIRAHDKGLLIVLVSCTRSR